MKKIILLFGICLVLFNCNNDDDQQPDPIVEEEPNLSFPDCLLSEDIFEYTVIMGNEPSVPRGELVKKLYQGMPIYFFNQHILHDFPIYYYNEDCEVYCVYNTWGPSEIDCGEDFWDNSEQIGVVWTDPR